MNNYKKLYNMMFNKVTDVIEELQKLQQDVEEEYLNFAEAEKTPPTNLKLIKKETKK